MANSYAGLYSFIVNKSVNGNSTKIRKWVVNVGEGQVEYPVFALARN